MINFSFPRRPRLRRPALAAVLLGLILPRPDAGAQVPARRADEFINSIGICTHWGYLDTPYGAAFPAVFKKLQESGIRHVRDGGGRLPELTAAGISSTFSADVPDRTDGTDATIRQLVTDLKAKLAAGYRIDVVEGPNEPDLFWRKQPNGFQKSYKGQGWQQGNDGIIKGTIAFMQDLHRALKADPATASIPLIGPSVTRTTGARLPDKSLEQYVDWGNFHPYCGGNPYNNPTPYAGLDKYWWYSTHPLANIADEYPWQFNEGQPPFGSKPMAATETGYSTWKESLSEGVHAKYMPRLFLEYFRRGIMRTYSYEFVDEFVDPGKTNREANFGLLHRDLTPKPAYTALKSLIKLLDDPTGNTFTPGSLAYSINIAPPAGYNRTQYVKHQLFQKKNGKFYLVIYHEISGEDGNVQPHRILTHPAMPTTISLPASIKQATRYTYDSNFTFQAAPLTISGGKISLGVTDLVTVLELSPAATPPPGTFGTGYYKLTARHSGKVLDVAGVSKADGANVHQWTYLGQANQQWQLIPVGDGYYQLTARHSGRALTVSGGASATGNGANVYQYSYAGGPNQQWKIDALGDGYYQLTARHSGKVLDVTGGPTATGNGADVHQWTYVGGANQQWKIEETTNPSTSTLTASRPAAPAGAPLELYPNPATQAFTVRCQAAAATTATIVVTDLLSRPVKQASVSLRAGQNEVQFDSHDLVSGVYLVEVVSAQSRQAARLTIE